MNKTNSRHPLKAIVFFLVFIFICFNQSYVKAGILDSTFLPSLSIPFWVNTVIKQDDGKFIIGGSFKSINNAFHNGISRLNSDGTPDFGFNIGTGANGTVYSIAIQPDGRLLVGGEFDYFDGRPCVKLVRLNPDGSLDQSFNTTQLTFDIGGDVRAIKVLSDGKILVGGNYRKLIVRLNANGSLDNTFTSNTSPFGGNVSTIVVQPDNKIIIGGSFSQYSNGIPDSSYVRLNVNGTVDLTFTAKISGISTCFIQPDGKTIIGGSFNFINGVPSGKIARINTDGTMDATFQSLVNGFSDTVTSIVPLPDGKFIVGGFFTFYQNVTQNRIVRINADGTLDASFNAGNGFDNIVRGLTISNDSIVAVGQFTTAVDNSFRFGIARLSTSGSLDSTFIPGAGISGPVNINVIKALPNGKVLVGGNFKMVNGLPRTALARLNPDGSRDQTFASSTTFNDGIKTIALSNDGKIIVAGSSFLVNGQFRYITRLDENGNVDTTFNPPISSTQISKISVLGDGKILIAGFYEISGGPTIRNFARFNQDGSFDTTFNLGTGFSGYVSDFEVQPNGQIIAIGNFSAFNGTPRNKIARINADGSLDTLFAVTITGDSVYDVSIQNDGKIIVSGNFTNVNGVSRNFIARLNSDSTLDLSFSSPFISGAVVMTAVRPNNKIVAVGFLGFSGVANQKIVAQLNENGTFNSSLYNNFSGFSGAVEILPDGRVIFGGTIYSNDYPNGNFLSYSLVRLTPQSVKSDFDGDGKTDISIFRPSVGEWYYQRSSNSAVNGAQFGSSTDKPAPADYTGDGKTDIAFFRPSTGEWFIIRSEDSSYFAFPFGVSGDIPAPGDFDGDGKADQAVFRPSNGVWYINKSGGGVTISTFGTNGDRPVVADYDGDGKADIAIFRPSVGEWYYIRSTDSQVRGNQFGSSTDKPVQGDYTGDGKADFAFFRPSTGSWFVLRSEDSSFFASPFGTSTDTPTPGDYDGDGKFDQAVFRPSNGVWYLNRSTAGIQIQQFGVGTDLPVPSYYLQ